MKCIGIFFTIKDKENDLSIKCIGHNFTMIYIGNDSTIKQYIGNGFIISIYWK